MAFNIHNIGRRNELSLIELLFNKKRIGKKEMTKNTNPLKRDTVNISSEAQALSKMQKVKTASSNTRIDQSIDLKACIENAQKANQEAIASAGDEINANNSKVYTSESDVYKSLLTEKYSQLVKEAKTHSNPELYIERKYFDSSSGWYASDLSKEERNIAYRSEMEMLRNGKIGGVAMGDSLFRGVTLHADAVTAAETEFNRQMVNSQINNILKKNGIKLADGQELSFKVVPYTFEITVEGVDEDTKWKIEKALNVGANGKNLYNHIRKSATGEGIASTQITEEGILKNRLFSEVSNTLGLDIRNLNEKNGTYYTDAGEDIIALYNKSVDESNTIQGEFKSAAKESFAKLVHQISSRGWINMADMILSINYRESGLIDKYQNYGFGSTSKEWLESRFKTSTYCVML